MTNNQIRRKFERLAVKVEKYPHQLTREDKDFLAKAVALKKFIEEKKAEENE